MSNQNMSTYKGSFILKNQIIVFVRNMLIEPKQEWNENGIRDIAMTLQWARFAAFFCLYKVWSF